MSLNPTIRKEAEELVKVQMAAYDPSHDWLHVDRVRRQGSDIDAQFSKSFLILFFKLGPLS